MTNLSDDVTHPSVNQVGNFRHPEPSEAVWDLAAIFADLVKGWKVVLPLLVAGGVLGVIASHAITPMFRAEALVMPSDDMLSQSQMAGSGGQLGGLASLVGLGGIDDRRYEAIETLKSRALTDQYVETNQLLPILFHSRWNADTKAWRSSDPEAVPTLEDAYKLFDKKLRTVTLDKKTGMIAVKFQWEDPKLATQWLRDFVAMTNHKMRAAEIERTQRNLDYLHEELDKTSTVEIRTVIYKLIEAQIKRAMLARGSDDFALRYVDPPVTPIKKISPVRPMYGLGGSLLVLMIMILWLYYRGPLRDDSARS